MRKISPSIPPSVRVELFRPLRMTRRTRKAALQSGALLVVFCVMLYAAAPSHLPLLIQRLVGLTSALLVMLCVTLTLNELGTRYRTFGISTDRFERVVGVLGWVVFAAVLAIWFTRLAPIQGY
jgi:hypothetical protein